MTELTFEELGTALDAVRCAIREQEQLMYAIKDNELRNRPASYPQDPWEDLTQYRLELRTQEGVYLKYIDLFLKLADMTRERQPG